MCCLDSARVVGHPSINRINGRLADHLWTRTNRLDRADRIVCQLRPALPCDSLGDVILDVARLKGPNHGPNADAHLIGYFLDREPRFA
jgi:hypothetical protein